jgi:AcrR family transcriptional regulator
LAKKALFRDDVRYLVFAEIYLRFSEPKTKRKAFALIEAAIDCFDKTGFEHVTLEMIAREAGVTRPLLRHYFSGLDEIRELSLKYIRVIGQKVVVEALAGATQPDEMLKRYLNAHFYWSSNFKTHIRVWLSFLSISSKRKRDRALNTIAIEAGTQRLIQLLGSGRAAGVFKHSDDFKAARLMQTLMLGWLVSMATEDLESREDFSKMVIEECLALVGAALT